MSEVGRQTVILVISCHLKFQNNIIWHVARSEIHVRHHPAEVANTKKQSHPWTFSACTVCKHCGRRMLSSSGSFLSEEWRCIILLVMNTALVHHTYHRQTELLETTCRWYTCTLGDDHVACTYFKALEQLVRQLSRELGGPAAVAVNQRYKRRLVSWSKNTTHIHNTVAIVTKTRWQARSLPLLSSDWISNQWCL